MRRPFLALMIASLPFGVASAQTAPDQPKIIVDGYGEVKTMPDVATISYTLRGEGSTSDEAVREMVAMGARLEGSLAAIDPAAEPHTDKVQVEAIKSPDCKERDYGPRQLSTGSCAIVGYVATQDVSIKTSKINDAGTMVGVVARAGGYAAEISGFGLRDMQQARRQAITSALADAATKATAVASGSQLTLGQILTVSTIGHEPGQPIIVTGQRLDNSNISVPSPPPVSVKLTPEPITTTANVSVTYAIQK